MCFLQCLVVALLVCSTAAGVYPNYRAHFDFAALHNEKNLLATKKWWETASFYQIYPRSFKDSDGDGIGDLRGITQQLPYLKELGITATWISPIFTSPMADFGYDVANFTDIDPIFGTMADFDALMLKSKEVGVKIILDFVPNHSSDESEWFKKSAASDPEYKDFYIWHPGKTVAGVRQPPTNWLSVFRGSAWQWHEGRHEYYLHQFLAKQPDLNYRNPKVKAAMNEVLRFWLRKGVSGFRIDACPFLFEILPDASGNQPDEPRNEAVKDPTDYAYLQHIYTTNQPETIEMIYNWRHVLDEFQQTNGGDERVILAEAYSPIDVLMQYYGNATVEGAQIPFNFLLIALTNSSNANNYADTVNMWLNNMPAGRTANWVIGNHDQNRLGSRLGADRIDMLNMLIMTLPGASVSYMGEEIGMTDVWISWNDTVDPSACNTNPDIYEASSRDPERTPFQWTDGPDAGFSTAQKTWLPIAGNYKEVNVQRERENPISHLNVYKQLLLLRQEPTLRYGNTEVKSINGGAVLGVKRELLNDFTYITLMNIFDKIETFDLNQTFNNLPKDLIYWIITDKSTKQLNALMPSAAIRLLPKEAVILRSVTKLTTTAGYYTYYAIKDQKN